MLKTLRIGLDKSMYKLRETMRITTIMCSSNYLELILQMERLRHRVFSSYWKTEKLYGQSQRD